MDTLAKVHTGHTTMNQVAAAENPSGLSVDALRKELIDDQACGPCAVPED
jgi:hypothetical protein